MADGETSTGDERELVEAALAALGRVYAPYSRFPVGAAVRTASGKVFAGVNVENASFGLTICGERSAACAAVSAGEREFVAMALVTNGGFLPCGACRQFLAEFAPDLPLLVLDTGRPGEVVRYTLDQLLPGRFTFPAGGNGP